MRYGRRVTEAGIYEEAQQVSECQSMLCCNETLTVAEECKDSLTLSVVYADHDDDKGKWDESTIDYINDNILCGEHRMSHHITPQRIEAHRGAYKQLLNRTG